MPQVNYVAIFCLDFVLLHVQTHSSRVMPHVAYQWILPTFHWLVLVHTMTCFVTVICSLWDASTPSLLSPPCLLFLFPPLSPLLLFFVERSSSIGISQCQAQTDMSKHQRYACESRTKDNYTKKCKGQNR